MRRRNALAANVAVLTSVMFAVFPASAQGPSSQAEMTVDELVARALADNPDLRAARREIDAALGRLRQAGLRPNPMLELGGQKALSPDNNLTAMLTFPLDLNGRKEGRDRKSTRLNSSHVSISYAVFCLKKKTISIGH